MIRYFRPLGFVLVLVLPVLPLQAQRGQTEGPTDIQVYVTFDDSRPAGEQLRVDLANATGLLMSQAFTDSSGRAILQVQSQGGYIVKVTGPGIKDGSSESFEVFSCPNHCMRQVFLRVKANAAPGESTATTSTAKPDNPSVTSAAELGVPQNARKAFDQGLSAWQKQDYKQAAEKFEQAVAEYPKYDTAYNNLGVMYAHLGQNDKAMAAFKRSVELNDKNADADRNLARMLMRQKDYPQAEVLLKKSLSVEPTEAATLTMLVMAEVEDGKPDEALNDAHKVHALPHDGYAVVHYIAGEVLEEKHQYAAASAEYNLYLKEAPNGPEAAQVRSAVARLSSPSASAAPKFQ
jgi:Tfp pilus assembly protein PilF